MIAAAFLILLAVYLACGLAFAIPFAMIGAKRIDRHAAHGSWGFRVLIIPGTMALWPLLLRRWAGGAKEPPEQRDAHRFAANNSRRRRRGESHPESQKHQRLVTSSPTDSK